MNPPYDPAYPGKPLAKLIPNPKLRFLDQCREVLRFKQMSPRTEKAYVDWMRRFIVWARDNAGADQASTKSHPTTGEPGGTPGARWRHPREMGAAEVRGFLTHLAAERNVAAATQNQAFKLVEG